MSSYEWAHMAHVIDVRTFVRKTLDLHALEVSTSYPVVYNACPALFPVDLFLFDAALENRSCNTLTTLQLLQVALDPRRRRGVPLPQLEGIREALLSRSKDIF